MNYIAVPNTLPACRWEIENLEAAAVEDGLMIERFNDENDLIQAFGGYKEDIPESYWKEVEKVGFPCVHVQNDTGSVSYWDKLDGFNAEEASLEFLSRDYHLVISINNIEDARYYATKYNGHQRDRVCALSREILEEMEEKINDKSRLGF